MKHLKIIITSAIVSFAVGMALGVNIGRDKPLLSNPFEKESLTEHAKRLSGETLEQSGKALEKAGQSLQGTFKSN